MQIASTFVEYLVTGCVALLWAIPLLPPRVVSRFSSTNNELVPLIIPLLYVLGMVIDSAASALLHPMKERIRREQKDRGVPDVAKERGIPSNGAFVHLKSESLARELSAKSSRDRIARGTFVNLTFGGMVAAGYGLWPSAQLPYVDSNNGDWIMAVVLAIMAFGAFFMWRQFERLSLRAKHEAVATIVWDEKNSRNAV